MAGDCGCDECLSHSHFVAEQGPTELGDGFLNPRDGRDLVRLERDGANPRRVRVVTENQSRDPGADFLGAG
jgi:hypothetical protein